MRVIVFFLSVFCAQAASADVIRYSYYGADASTFTGVLRHPDGLYDPVTGTFEDLLTPTGVPSDLRVVGWLEVDGGLAANLVDQDVSGLVNRWAFKDVFGTYNYIPDPLKSDLYDGAVYPVGTSSSSIVVSTDANGDIIEWDVSFEATVRDWDYSYGYLSYQYDLYYAVDGNALNGEITTEGDSRTNWFDAPYSETIYSSNQVGAWSAAVVPVPAAVWLFGSALAGLGWLRRKQTV